MRADPSRRWSSGQRSRLDNRHPHNRRPCRSASRSSRRASLNLPSKCPRRSRCSPAQELTDRGARDLESALALATGVTIAPGGDGGPASSVPEFWGLKEFDAFLLVVDGVPWGGAFNPALATLSLTDVARIEVMRGPAPVTYGATSFVGVIHVVHKTAAETSRAVSAHAGSFGSGGVVAALPFSFGGFDSRLTADVDRQGYKDDRTSFTRAHALWRNTRNLSNGHFWFNVDATWLDQNPASPHPRVGQSLTPLVPLDANQNPDGAFLNEKRAAFMAGFDRKVGSADWTLTGSFSRSAQDILRGFLNTLEDTEDNATGLREQIDLTGSCTSIRTSPGRCRRRPASSLVATTCSASVTRTGQTSITTRP